MNFVYCSYEQRQNCGFLTKIITICPGVINQNILLVRTNLSLAQVKTALPGPFNQTMVPVELHFSQDDFINSLPPKTSRITRSNFGREAGYTFLLIMVEEVAKILPKDLDPDMIVYCI
jgi:hypothetical protein